MRAYRKVCGEVVARYEGHVAQYLGDGLMVYFGWPSAREDDPSNIHRLKIGLPKAGTQFGTIPRQL